jgi:hypothetical protein
VNLLNFDQPNQALRRMDYSAARDEILLLFPDGVKDR